MQVIFTSLLFFLVLLMQGLTAESKSGSGQCDTDLDCKNKGLCLASKEDEEKIAEGDDKEFGKCFCFQGRTGENCEIDEATGKASKKTHLSNLQPVTEMASRRVVIFFHSFLKATGLDPKEVAKAGTVVSFYNPRTSRFVMVGKKNFMVTDPKHEGEGRWFKLKDAGDEKYNIIARDSDDTTDKGFLYLSNEVKGSRSKNRRVMISPKEKDEESYKFKFIEHKKQNGIYKIKCDGQLLYASEGGHNFKGDLKPGRTDSEEIWFQLNFEENKNIKVVEPEEKRMRDVITNNNAIKVTDEVYKNEASTEMPIKINKAQKASKLVEFFNKLSTAVKIGTGKAVPFVNAEIGITGETSTSTTMSKESESSNEINFIVAPHMKDCIVYMYRVAAKYDEQELEITNKGKKFKGFRLIQTSNSNSFEYSRKEVPLDKSC